MSGTIVGEALEHAPSDLTTAQLLVLVALAEDARDKGPYARQARIGASVAALMRRTRLSESGVKNALGELKRRGLIVPLIPQARLGKAQNYYLPKLEKHHRDAHYTTTEGDF